VLRGSRAHRPRRDHPLVLCLSSRLVPPFPRNSNGKVGLADLYPVSSPASIVAHTRLFQGRAAVSLTSMERGPIYWPWSSTPHHRSVKSRLVGSPFATEDVISHCAGQRSNRDAGDPWQTTRPAQGMKPEVVRCPRWLRERSLVPWWW
jgi:hypothetical protein